jgi:hypothetical protein
MQFLLSLPLGHPKDRATAAATAAANARSQSSEAGVQAREVRLMTRAMHRRIQCAARVSIVAISPGSAVERAICRLMVISRAPGQAVLLRAANAETRRVWVETIVE